ncbi:hypothetical protein SAMN06297387_103258 [Streptomyces zhaozhouensis]|uniref:Tetratricopeptide repeat-containing protein n=1 Tax=Streptomyces zhaozhouensis TaxID=1300267 RepID=A0A286DSF6_9ACTN|nr:hypothetical protein [Streptomyces zhaozhouensis]SOD61606.1 hypothetical protein SAMN06297387_103258 [Streptomyces zhaozhouensis]
MRKLFRVHVVRAGDDETPTRIGVLLLHHEPWWDAEDPLPEGPGFFVQVLREAADGKNGRPGGPLGDEFTVEQSLDTEWIEENAHRYVARVERVEVRHHPVDEALCAWYRDNHDALERLTYVSTFNRRYRAARDLPLEERLVRADYDVWVTAPRWTRTLRAGDRWGTDAWGPLTTAGDASLRRAFIRREEGRPDAVAAFERALALGDAETRVRARLALDDLRSGRGETATTDVPARECEARLELALRLHAEGEEEEARAAFALAVRMDSHVIGEARRRAELESPAEYGYRLARRGELSRAVAHLRLAYHEDPAVVSFALAVYEGEVERALGIDFGGDLALRHGYEIAAELAFLHARDSGVETARRLMEFARGAAGALGGAGDALGYALATGAAQPAALAREFATRLAGTCVSPADDQPMNSLVEATRRHFPDVAALGCRLQAKCHEEYAQSEEAAHWRDRLAELRAAPPGNVP